MTDTKNYGLMRVQTGRAGEERSKMRYFKECRVLRADAKKGDIEITLLDGTKVRAYAENVHRWPSFVEVEQ